MDWHGAYCTGSSGEKERAPHAEGSGLPQAATKRTQLRYFAEALRCRGRGTLLDVCKAITIATTTVSGDMAMIPCMRRTCCHRGGGLAVLGEGQPVGAMLSHAAHPG